MACLCGPPLACPFPRSPAPAVRCLPQSVEKLQHWRSRGRGAWQAASRALLAEAGIEGDD